MVIPAIGSDEKTRIGYLDGNERDFRMLMTEGRIRTAFPSLLHWGCAQFGVGNRIGVTEILATTRRYVSKRRSNATRSARGELHLHSGTVALDPQISIYERRHREIALRTG